MNLNSSLFYEKGRKENLVYTFFCKSLLPILNEREGGDSEQKKGRDLYTFWGSGARNLKGLLCEDILGK